MIIEKIFKSDPPILRVSMLGPRGVGKTTVLTSIFMESVQSIAGTKLFLRAVGETALLLGNNKIELRAAFENNNPANLPASSGIQDFNFELGINGKTKARLIIKDFPGEFVTRDDKKEEVDAFISEANIVLVAIDTPYMMEENGKYNEVKNEVKTVIKFLSEEKDKLKDKLILFTPLKCEYYFHNNRIKEVSDRVVEEYGELIPFMKENNIASFITPIVTLGDCEFKCMEQGSQYGLSMIASYQFIGDNPQYRPMYCNQPLYHLLSYVAKSCQYMKDHPSQGSFFDKILKKISGLFINDKEFLYEIRRLERFLLIDEDGFKSITKNSILYK